MKTRLSNFWWVLPNPLESKCIQNCINWLICLHQITNMPKHLISHLPLFSSYCNNKLWPLPRTELGGWKTSRGMSSTEFLYFIKTEAIWTEWRGQSICPGTVWDDLSLTPSMSCALYYGTVSRLFLLPEKYWYCISLFTREESVRSSQRVQLHLNRLLSLPFVSLCCWHWSKQDATKAGMNED